MVAVGKGEDIKGTMAEPMSMDDKTKQPATLTAPESAAIPIPGQPQNMKTDDNKAVMFSIGPSQQPTGHVGAPHTNADEAIDKSSGQPVPQKAASSSALFQTNADIPQEMMDPPFSAPPTPAHRHHAQIVGKQFSTPLFGSIKETTEALNEPQHIYSQFSETNLKDEYQSQVSVVDLPSEIHPVQKVSMDDEAIMQRQQQRFKMIEEQNKTKSLQFKQTYSDPYSYKSTERVQSKQRRGQGWCFW